MSVTLNDHLNDVQRNIEVLMIVINDLIGQVSQIKSCDCNHEEEEGGGGIGIPQDEIDELTNYLRNQNRHLEEHLGDIDENINRLNLGEQVQSFQDAMLDVVMYEDAIPDIAKQAMEQQDQEQQIPVFRPIGDRSNGLYNQDSNYVWDIIYEEWRERDDNLDRPAGWRRNRNAPVPQNYMWDVVHDEWVMLNIYYPSRKVGEKELVKQ